MSEIRPALERMSTSNLSIGDWIHWTSRRNETTRYGVITSIGSDPLMTATTDGHDSIRLGPKVYKCPVQPPVNRRGQRVTTVIGGIRGTVLSFTFDLVDVLYGKGSVLVVRNRVSEVTVETGETSETNETSETSMTTDNVAKLTALLPDIRFFKLKGGMKTIAFRIDSTDEWYLASGKRFEETFESLASDIIKAYPAQLFALQQANMDALQAKLDIPEVAHALAEYELRKAIERAGKE